jgi:hypothetical protein
LRAAIPAYERTLADRERLQGPDHKDTRTARTAYRQAGRVSEAISHYRRALADSELHLGPGHPMTRAVRDNLAAATGT